MKNITSIKLVFGMIFALAVFAALGAVPVSAQAYYYPYGNYSSAGYCSYPQVASIAQNGYYYCTYPNQTPAYQSPSYQYPTYQPITVSCSANTTSASAGSSVQWTAYVTGGNGSYTYTWSGTDGLYGSGQSVNMYYSNSGTKTAQVTVYSGGQSSMAICNNSVNIYSYNYNYGYNYYQPTYVQPTYVQPTYVQPTYYGGTNQSGLEIGCFADPGTALVNQPVTWKAEVTGGALPYKYTWTGSDGLAGSSDTAIMYYSTTGAKNAIVTVTSADGRTGTQACSNTANISRPGAAPSQSPTQQPAQQPAQNQSNLSAAALFSLGNIPWGWVAVLVILVLFATVMYLLFNKPKI